jgi:hypothetical protein
MALLSTRFTVAHFTSLQNKITSHKSRQFTPNHYTSHHFTYLHLIPTYCHIAVISKLAISWRYIYTTDTTSTGYLLDHFQRSPEEAPSSRATCPSVRHPCCIICETMCYLRRQIRERRAQSRKKERNGSAKRVQNWQHACNALFKRVRTTKSITITYSRCVSVASDIQ